MKITASLVKDLRVKTGAGMMDCKKALVETEGDVEKAIDLLRTKGIAKAGKKASRIASEGAVGSYIHMGGKIGVLIEVNCETDFVGKTERFAKLVKDLAMQVAATNPTYVRPEEIPADVLDKEKEIFKQQAMEEGKPEQFAEKIVVGRIKKFYKQVCLLEQPYIKEDKKTVGDIVKAAIAEIGENIQVRRFARFELGEGIEKKSESLAEEVAKVVKGA